ncbi:ATP synthase F1 subunit delta [Azotosporobacter soli]|jgi:F-type H+-transporting ATPase subunit delta|uniref:ATP synthase F1 subunit delta n=1 Tax=Azotosporobacter soli TaxID=3055040 RepID=UPI0031FF0694
MLSNQLAVKYAQALFELAAERDMLGQVQQELEIVAETLRQHKDLGTLIYHPRVLPQAKKDTLRQIFANEVQLFVLNFLLLLVDKRRETALPGILQEYTKLANTARGIVEAQVVTAVPLTEAQAEALAAKLGQAVSRKVVLKTRVDQSILGGVVVQMGDKLIDGSVVRQLSSMRSALLKSEATRIEVTD